MSDVVRLIGDTQVPDADLRRDRSANEGAWFADLHRGAVTLAPCPIALSQSPSVSGSAP